MRNATNPRQIGEGLVRKGIPVEWQRAGHPYGDTIRGMLQHTRCRVCLGHDDRFAWLGVWGFREKAPSVLLEMGAYLSGPMRLVRRWPGGTVHGLATWPEGWPANAVIECLGPDLRSLSHPGPQDETSVHPLSQELKNWLRDLASTRTPLRIVPAAGPEFEFIAACQGRMRQIRAEQLGQHLVSLGSFVTSWPTDRCCSDATAQMVLVLNARLRWVRLRRLANQLVRESRALQLRVYVYTNGVPPAFTEQVTLRLLATATAQVRFSVPAATAATYATITNPASSQEDLFESVVSRVRRLPRVRDAIGGRSRIGVSFLMVPENAAELQEAAHLWLRSGIDFFDVRTDAAGTLSHGRPVRIAIQALRRRVELGCFGPMQVSLPEDPPHGRCFAQRCYAPLEKLVVDPWGYVWTCCLLAQPGIRPRWARVGNLRVESFLDVVARVKGMAPFRHCRGCTPFEARYNRLSEQSHGKDVLALQDKPADQLAHPGAGRPLSCGV